MGHPGDSIYLKSYNGRRIDVDGEVVKCRYGYFDPRQVLIIDKHRPPERRPGRAGTGIPLGPDKPPTPPGLDNIEVGDDIFLLAHTGKYVSVVRTVAQASWDERSLWQTFTIE